MLQPSRPTFNALERVLLTFSLSLIAITATANPASAIPSPELVVGSLTSLSQLTALLSAIFGGGALAVGSRLSKGGSGDVRRLKLIALGCFAAALSGLGLAAYFYQQSTKAERNRLEQTLLRPTPKAGEGKTLDPLLKEISYNKQMTHPRGLTTTEAENIVSGVAAHTLPDWMILDIRETAETEMGSLPGAVKIRFPDIANSKIDFVGKKALLICHNGNRSAETCEALAAKGIDCRFIAGGLEKWLTEGRTLQGSDVRSLEDLRALPPYPNQATLLDTARVHELVDNGGAIFVDVRYPGEFASGHLAGAINVPIRPTPTADLAKLIESLPNKPVIAPCYDRRSCFFGEILGLSLTRAGREFLGRYSVPWEYFTPSKRPPHVEALLLEQNKTLWMKAGETVASGLRVTAEKIGLPLALLLMALLSRIIVLPFSIKSERDQIAARVIKDRVADLKTRLALDPQRQARALNDLYARAGMTPGRNLIALLFLPILALAVGAAVHVAQNMPTRFLWVNDLAQYDPWMGLPLLFAGLLGIYLTDAFVTTRRHAVIVWAIAVPLLFAAAAILPAAAGLYMTASALLLLVQRMVITGIPGWRALTTSLSRKSQRFALSRLGAEGIVPLTNVAELSAAGNKAKRLAELTSLSLPVPSGLVLTPDFLATLRAADDRWRTARMKAIWRYFSKRPLAVRSSGALEDGDDMSFAGVFESVLDCDLATLEDAISKVATSFEAANANAYKAGAAGQTGHILIQPMVAAQYAGVLFTEDMQEPGQILVELVEGTADKLVSGRATPQSFRFGRLSGVLAGPVHPPIDLAPLIELSRRVEAHYGRPQDIEWAFDGDTFLLLQTRDITATLGDTDERDERRRLLAQLGEHAPVPTSNTVVFAQGDIAELLPRPTPASLSLLNAMWTSGGSVDLALRSLGFTADFKEDGPPLYLTVFGRLYADRIVETQIAPRISRLALRRLNRALGDIERSFRENFLPEFLRDIRLLQTANFNQLSTNELHDAFTHVRKRFIEDTHAEVSRINIAAQFAFDRARDSLKAHGFDQTRYLSHANPTELERLLPTALREAEHGNTIALRDLIGHRANLDYELRSPRHAQSNELVEIGKQMATALCTPKTPLVGDATLQSELPAAIRHHVTDALALQTLKEDAKHHGLRHLAVMRSILVALDTRYGLDGGVFFLTLDDIAKLDEANSSTLSQLARHHRDLHTASSSRAPLPAQITLSDMEGTQATHNQLTRAPRHGQRVSGAMDVTGLARVVSTQDAENGIPIADLRDGEIIVAPFLHPAWLPELVRSGGVVVTIGGWLSHMAIVAREHDKAMIVGAHGLDAIETGSHIRLCADGKVEILAPAQPQFASAAE